MANLASEFSNLGVEQIYVANLDFRFDRRVKALFEFRKHGLNPLFVEAIDAKADIDAKRRFYKFLSQSELEGKYVSHLSRQQKLVLKKNISLGAFGYVLTQKKIFKHAIKSGYKNIAVFDDDIFFSPDSKRLLAKVNRTLEDQFSVLLLGASDYSICGSNHDNQIIAPEYNTYNPLPAKTLGSFGVLYNQSIYHEILEAIDSNCGTYDNVVLGHIYSKYPGKCHVICPNIITPVVEDSNIRPGRCQKQQSLKMGWSMDRYQEYQKGPSVTIFCCSIGQVSSLEDIKRSAIATQVRCYYLSEDGPRLVVIGMSNRDETFLEEDIITNLGSPGIEKELCESVHYTDRLVILNEDSALNDSSLKQFILESLSSEGATTLSFGRVICCVGKTPLKDSSSIIIPLGRSLDEAWPSIKSAIESHGRSEVIVVDDSLPPTSQEDLLCQLVKTNGNKANIKYILHKKKRYASGARNTGFLYSKGEYINFLDDDDIYLPEKVQHAASYLSCAPTEEGGVYCGYEGGAFRDSESNFRCESNPRYRDGDLSFEILTLGYSRHFLNTDTMTFRKTAILDSGGGFNESYERHQDIELNIRFFLKYRTGVIKKQLVIIRPNRVSATVDLSYDFIVELKRKLMRDFSHIIAQYSPGQIRKILDSHVADIKKRHCAESAGNFNPESLRKELWSLLDKDEFLLEQLAKSVKRCLHFDKLIPFELINIDSLTRNPRFYFGRNDLFDLTDLKRAPIDYSSRRNVFIKSLETDGYLGRLRYCFDNAVGNEIPGICAIACNYIVDAKLPWKLYERLLNRYLAFYGGEPIAIHGTSDNHCIFQLFASAISPPAQPQKLPADNSMVSVIMPLYNNERTIDYSIGSILSQKGCDLQLILVDDCSTDGTYARCKELGDKDDRITLIRNADNRGCYYSRNKALSFCKGQYITILDGDDWSPPSRILFQLQRLMADKTKKVHLGYYIRMMKSGIISGFRPKGKFSYDGILHKCLASMMFEAEFFAERLGCWDTVRFGADAEMYYRILAINPDLILEDTVPIYYALQSSNSLTESATSRLGGSARSAYAKAFNEFHITHGRNLKRMQFPQAGRPFPVNSDML